MSKRDKYWTEPTISQTDAVDENGSPLLEEVVEEAGDSKLLQPDTGPSHPDAMPDSDALVEKIRLELKAQIQEELNSIIQPVVSIAVEQATAELEKVVKDELRFSLHKRLEELIESALKKQFGNP